MKTRGYRVELVRLSVCPSVRLSVCPSVRPSVRLSVPFDVGYFAQASLVWRSWARAFKFYTRINQGLKSCLVKVLSRSVENCRFWSTLKIVDFKLFSDAKHFVQASFVWGDWARAFKFYTHINQGLKSCLVKVLSGSVEHCRFWNTLKIVDFNNFTRC